jgi:putative salt-induced outer membrane protein YdiY
LKHRCLRVSAAVSAFLAVSASSALVRPVAAQDCPPCPPPPPAGWNISVGGGLSLTGGNTDTSSYSLSANVVYDPKKKNLFRGEALYLRASEEDRATVSRTAASLRDEYKVNGRAFVFGQLGYLRDRFKELDYLLAPVAGLGVRVVDRPNLLLSVDGGAGGAFEKLEDQDSTTNLALQATQRLEWQLTPGSRFLQKSGGLWKADDLEDAYYRLELGIATTITKGLELKVAFIDDYKARPARPELEKNDTSFLASILFKP